MNETTAVVEGGIKHWHPEIHFQLHEYVRYVRVSLTSGYSTDQYFESFRKMCEKAKIENFTVLEVYGTHDLVIRVFSRQMRSSLEALFHWIRSPHDTITATHAPVGDYRQCLHHWLWSQDGKTYPLPVDPELLQDIVQNSTEIETRLLEDFGLEVLEEKNALRIEAAPNPGIRFLVFISRASDPEKSMPNGAKEQYAKDVVQTVLAIDGITHEEIYEGDRSDWLIIDARAEFGNYFAINKLKSALFQSVLASLGCRITTYLCCNNIEGVLQQEKLRPTQDVETPPLTEGEIIEILLQPENSMIEVKGSIRANMDLLLRKGEKETMKPKDGVDPVLKTIAAFLNSSGGTLIIGAVETQNFKGVDLSELPELGEYRICGLDEDMTKDGFDKASKHVSDKIRQNINSAAGRLCEIAPFEHEGKLLMAVRVLKSQKIEYYQNDIYVRENATTIKLSTEEAIQFAQSFTDQ